MFFPLFLYLAIENNLDNALLSSLWRIMPSLVESPALYEISCKYFVTLSKTTWPKIMEPNLQFTLNKIDLSVVNNILFFYKFI